MEMEAKAWRGHSQCAPPSSGHSLSGQKAKPKGPSLIWVFVDIINNVNQSEMQEGGFLDLWEWDESVSHQSAYSLCAISLMALAQHERNLTEHNGIWMPALGRPFPQCVPAFTVQIFHSQPVSSWQPEWSAFRFLLLFSILTQEYAFIDVRGRRERGEGGWFLYATWLGIEPTI